MKIHRMEQRTTEWMAVRLGIPTASNFDSVLMGKGTKGRQDYICRLVMERILGIPMNDEFVSKWMEHGIAMEDEAIAEFRAMSNVMTERVGFITANNGRYGCSPDQLVIHDGMPVSCVEVKCPAPWTHCRYHVYGLGDAYKAQVQGQMLVTGFDRAYFYSYFPGMPPVSIETKRDDKYIKNLEGELERFCDDVDKYVDHVKGIGPMDVSRASKVYLDVLGRRQE